MKQILRWLAAAIVVPGLSVMAQEKAAEPAAAPAAPAAGAPAGRTEFQDLQKQIKDAEAPVLEKNAELKTAVEALDKQMADLRADRSKMRDPAVRQQFQDLQKQRQEKMVAAEPKLADLYKKMNDLRAARRGGRAGGGEAKPAEKGEAK